VDSSFSPSCSCKAVKNEGASGSAAIGSPGGGSGAPCGRSCANFIRNRQLPVRFVRSITGRPAWPTSMPAACDIGKPSNVICPMRPRMLQGMMPSVIGGPPAGCLPWRSCSARALQSVVEGLSARPGAPGCHLRRGVGVGVAHLGGELQLEAVDEHPSHCDLNRFGLPAARPFPCGIPLDLRGDVESVAGDPAGPADQLPLSELIRE